MFILFCALLYSLHRFLRSSLSLSKLLVLKKSIAKKSIAGRTNTNSAQILHLWPWQGPGENRKNRGMVGPQGGASFSKGKIHWWQKCLRTMDDAREHHTGGEKRPRKTHKLNDTEEWKTVPVCRIPHQPMGSNFPSKIGQEIKSKTCWMEKKTTTTKGAPFPHLTLTAHFCHCALGDNKTGGLQPSPQIRSTPTNWNRWGGGWTWREHCQRDGGEADVIVCARSHCGDVRQRDAPFGRLGADDEGVGGYGEGCRGRCKERFQHKEAKAKVCVLHFQKKQNFCQIILEKGVTPGVSCKADHPKRMILKLIKISSVFCLCFSIKTVLIWGGGYGQRKMLNTKRKQLYQLTMTAKVNSKWISEKNFH